MRVPPRLVIGAVAAALTATACSDVGVAPAPAARGGPGIATPPGAPLASATSYAGDTTISTFTVNGNGGTWVIVAGEHRLIFGNGLASICDPATSSYGPAEWNAPCSPATAPITITARVWTTAGGRAQIDFSPALRFVPTSTVTLQMYDKQATESTLGAHVEYCPTAGGPCVREALLDRTLRSYVGTNGFLNRRLKHFSGYIVAIGRECDAGDEAEYPECGGEGQ